MSIRGRRNQSFQARVLLSGAFAAKIASNATVKAWRMRPFKNCGGDWKMQTLLWRVATKSMLSSDARASLYWLGCSIGRGSASGGGGAPCCGGGASELLVLVLDEDVDEVEEVVSSGSSLVSLALVFVLGMSSLDVGASGL